MERRRRDANTETAMHGMTKKHVLALVAASAMVLGSTSLSTARDGVKKSGMKRSHHVAMQQHGWNSGWQAQAANPLSWPFAAVEGAGLAAGAIVGGTAATVGGTAAALTGHPYGPYGTYGSYAQAPGYDAYGSYNDAPGGFARDIGHSYYNGFGSPAPASQDNCAVDAGYGRKDYSLAC
jgi:hypothetical protein